VGGQSDASRGSLTYSDAQPIGTLAQGLEAPGGLGQIKINHSVVASIVRLAALEVPGVHGVGGGLVDEIAEIFSKKENDRGVRVHEDETGLYTIEIRVVLEYGVELAKVAMHIQETVSRQVTHMTMKGVGKVNVIIDGVKLTHVARHSPEETELDAVD
jgi:uncharacterized alkaline shock family protein YloU